MLEPQSEMEFAAAFGIGIGVVAVVGLIDGWE